MPLAIAIDANQFSHSDDRRNYIFQAKFIEKPILTANRRSHHRQTLLNQKVQRITSSITKQ